MNCKYESSHCTAGFTGGTGATGEAGATGETGKLRILKDVHHHLSYTDLSLEVPMQF